MTVIGTREGGSKTGLASGPSFCGTYLYCSNVHFFRTARLGNTASSAQPGLLAVHCIGFGLLLRDCLPEFGRFLLLKQDGKVFSIICWVMWIVVMAVTLTIAVQKFVIIEWEEGNCQMGYALEIRQFI